MVVGRRGLTRGYFMEILEHLSFLCLSFQLSTRMDDCSESAMILESSLVYVECFPLNDFCCQSSAWGLTRRVYVKA